MARLATADKLDLGKADAVRGTGVRFRCGRLVAVFVPLVAVVCVAASAVATGDPMAAGRAGALGARSSPGSRHRLVWVLTRRALAHVASDPAALAIVERGRIYEIVTRSSPPVAGVRATMTEAFPSYAEMASTVEAGTLVPRVRALLYDPEHWTRTPLAEQRQVRKYLEKAVRLAHRHKLEIVATPGLDLVQVLSPGARDTAAARYLATGVEATAARADVVDVQAQSTEADPTEYAWFVRAAASEIRDRNPSAVVIAGLSTNPPTGPITSGVLEADIRAVEGVVGGFWLNMPTQGPSCPKCSTNVNWRAGTSALEVVWG